MTSAQAIAAYEEHASRLGRVPDRLPLVVYAAADDLSCGPERATEGDLTAHIATVEALTEHARARGSVVIHVQFDPADYLRWLGTRPDSRALRALWATEQP